MRKNRILSLILALIILVMPFAAFANGSQGSSYKMPSYASELLEALDIMSVSETNSEREISRAYAAEILFRLLDGEEGTATGAYYADVTADTPYAYAIERTTELGYFCGTGDGNFDPDGQISLAGMARLLLQFAGYGIATGESSVVSQVYKHTSNYGNTTSKDLAQMIFNVLSMDSMYIESMSVGGNGYAVDGDIPVMATLLDVYEIKGVITENDITALWAGSSLNEGEVSISTKDGNVIVKAGSTDIGEQIGRTVRVFAKLDEDYDEYVALSYSFQTNEKVTEVNLLDFDYASSTANELHYELEGKEKKIKYNAQTAIIYNGTYYADGTFNFATISGLEGVIKAIDTNSDNTVDVFDIYAYDTYVVKGVNLTDKIVFQKNKANKEEYLSLDPEDYDRFTFTDEKGIKVYLEDFVPGMVVSYAKNAQTANKQVIRAYVSDSYVSGKISDIQDEDGIRYVTIDGQQYFVLPSVATIPSIGKEVYVSLTVFGNVAFFDTARKSGENVGIIANIKYTDTGDGIRIKIAATDGEIHEYVVAETVRIDGRRYKFYEDARTYLLSIDPVNAGNTPMPQGCFPVVYKLNANGEIMELDTPETGTGGEGDKLFEMESRTGGSGYLHTDLVLAGEFPLTEDTPVMRIDYNGDIDKKTMNDSENYYIRTAGELSKPRSMNYFSAYSIDRNSKYPLFVLASTNTASWNAGSDDYMFVLDKIKDTWDPNTQQILPKISGYESGVYREYIVSEEYKDTFNSKNLQKGDLLRFATGAYGHLVALDDDEATLAQTASGIEIRNIYQGYANPLEDYISNQKSVHLICGYVLEREGDLITIGYVPINAYGDGAVTIAGDRSYSDITYASYDATSGTGTKRTEALMRVPAGAVITVYNQATNEIYPATYDEIIGSRNAGASNCSFVVMRFRSRNMMEMIVYNNNSFAN